MTKTPKRSPAGVELAAALGEVLDDVTGKAPLPGRAVHVPDEIDVRAIRRRLGLSQKAFAARFAIDLRLLQDWEQGRRRPAGPARVLLTLIDRMPEQVAQVLEAA